MSPPRALPASGRGRLALAGGLARRQSLHLLCLRLPHSVQPRQHHQDPRQPRSIRLSQDLDLPRERRQDRLLFWMHAGSKEGKEASAAPLHNVGVLLLLLRRHLAPVGLKWRADRYNQAS